MHLNFLDTSPLKDFAICLRCRQRRLVCRQAVSFVNLHSCNNLQVVENSLVSFVDNLSTNETRVDAACNANSGHATHACRRAMQTEAKYFASRLVWLKLTSRCP